jgi:hypothetical protein
LLFVRRGFSGQKISSGLFTRCTNDFNEATVNAAEAAVGFYQKVGFMQSGDRFFKNGIWGSLQPGWSRLMKIIAGDVKMIGNRSTGTLAVRSYNVLKEVRNPE